MAQFEKESDLITKEDCKKGTEEGWAKYDSRFWTGKSEEAYYQIEGKWRELTMNWTIACQCNWTNLQIENCFNAHKKKWFLDNFDFDLISFSERRSKIGCSKHALENLK